MKKLKMITGMLFFAVAMISCGSDDSSDSNQACDSATGVTALAAQAFESASDEDYTVACDAYKSALQNQIAACGDPSGTLQATIDDLGDCTLDSPGVISVTVGTLIKTFETNITVVTVGTTIQVRAEDGGTTNDFIYFEIQQGQTGADVIANFNIHLITKDYTPLPDAVGGNWTSNITVNSATAINGTFFGYVTSSDNATLSLTNGVIDIDL